jgi:hypothetical protein
LERGLDERRATLQVLGMTYEELGAGVGKAWNLPPTILSSMRASEGRVVARPTSEADKMRIISDLSNSLANVVRTATDRDRNVKLAALVEKFGVATGVSASRLSSAVLQSMGRLARDAEVLGYGKSTCPVVVKARSWGLGATPPETEHSTMDSIVAGTILRTTGFGQLANSPDEAADGTNRQAALAAGVQDITQSLAGDYHLNDTLRMILETMYRAMGFSRVLLFVAEPARQLLRCRYGFGTDADAIVQKGLSMPSSGARDVFYPAVVQGADLCLADLDAEKVRPYVPQWYRQALGAKGMVLLPVIVAKKTVGLIYADSEQPGALHFNPEELSLLKTLRNQAILAIRQKT